MPSDLLVVATDLLIGSATVAFWTIFPCLVRPKSNHYPPVLPGRRVAALLVRPIGSSQMNFVRFRRDGGSPQNRFKVFFFFFRIIFVSINMQIL